MNLDFYWNRNAHIFTNVLTNQNYAGSLIKLRFLIGIKSNQHALTSKLTTIHFDHDDKIYFFIKIEIWKLS